MSNADKNKSRVLLRVMSVLAKYLSKPCMDAVERLAFPGYCSNTNSLRLMRALIKVRGHLSQQAWTKVIFLATSRTHDGGESYVSWDRPDASLLRVASARHRDCAPTLLKLLCDHPDVLKDMKQLERIKRLAPHDLCHLCDPLSIPCEQRVDAVMKCLKYFSTRHGNKKNERFLEQLLATMPREDIAQIAAITPFELHHYKQSHFIERYCQENMIHAHRRAFASKQQYDFISSFTCWKYYYEHNSQPGLNRLMAMTSTSPL